MDLISIIVPVYNAEPYLDHCIRSLVNQTYPNIEIVLVNDGSTDLSLSICESWTIKDTRVRILSKQNGGVSSARNAGLDAASGAFIYFCDADDVIISTCLDSLSCCQKKYNSDITVGRVASFYSPNTDLSDILANISKEQSYALSNQRLFSMPGEKRYIVGKLIKRECIGSTRFDPAISLGEDSIFFYSLLLKKLSLSYCPSAVYIYYRDHESASSGAKVVPTFYYVGKWCFQNSKPINSDAEINRYLFSEGFKNLFLYRHLHRKDRRYPYKKSAATLLNKAIPRLFAARKITFIQKTAFCAMTYIPLLYSLYAWWKNRQ